jgi:N-acetyl-1-D-myo-inositol-2-amino-2-deoxy-alpha-D-glucopyranoside deacetylase
VSGLEGRSILAVFAHPDDESLACGGTLVRLADEGVRVVLICATHGERGSLSGPVLDDELGRTRSLELRDAAAALGIADVLILDHPDGNLRWAGVTELHAQIVMAIRQYAPAAVITFGEDGLYWHLDHIGVHERATTAVESLGADAPPLYYVTMPPGAMRAIVDGAVSRGWTAPPQGFWSLAPDAFGDGARPPTLIVNVEAWVPRKIAAIQCHRSQMGASQPLAQIGEAEARRWLGIEHFRRAPHGASNEPVLEELAGESRGPR